MWTVEKEKGEDFFMGGHHPPGMGMGMHNPRHHMYRTLETHLSASSGSRPTVLWKGDTVRKRRFEPFCSPIVPHIPIRQRLAYRRCTSVDAQDDGINGSISSYGYPARRRKMSLLQSLRQQNKQLADSGFDMNRQRTDSENTASPPNKLSPPSSPSKSNPLQTLKQRTKALFGKKEHTQNGTSNSHHRLESRKSMAAIPMNGECSHSSDPVNGRSRKSPSTTNDSGRGSQGHLEDRIIVDRPKNGLQRAHKVTRTSSCPNLLAATRAPLVHGESDDDEVVFSDKNCSPITAADARIERLLRKRAMDLEQKLRLVHPSNAVVVEVERHHVSNFDEEDEMAEEGSIATQRDRHARNSLRVNDDVLSRTSMAYTEDLADFDDNVSTILLDHYLPLSRSNIVLDDGGFSSSSSSIDLVAPWPERAPSDGTGTSTSATTTSAQTDLSLVNCPEHLNGYLESLNLEDQGMNFIAKHFFEYQSFVNLPHKAVQLHKTPACQAGTDPSVGWAPKNMNKAGKNQPAPAARANRLHRDPRPNGTKHGRAGKHEHREWGDRHGELKDEKVAPHKDAWTKFLSNEDPGQRTVFECDFEDRVLQTQEETLPERIARTRNPDDTQFQMAYNASKGGGSGECELLTILTYAPLVQFVTATVKKAKALPYNNSPFARIMLFDGRRLIEQKQTTVNPSVGPFPSVETSSKPSSSSSSVSEYSGDAAFSESFLFHVIPEKLDKCHIVIEMFDHTSDGHAISVGHCVLGRMGFGTGSAHWMQMLKKPQLPVCMWHRIGPAL